MNKLPLLFSLSISLAVVSGISACGGGGSSGSDNSASGSSSGGSSSGGSSSGGSSSGGGTTSVPFNCESSEAFEGTTYKTEMGSVGKITRLPCEADTALAGVYQLETATPSLNITTAARKIIIDMSCEDGNAKGSINFDYTAGTVTFKGTFNGAPANTDGVADSCVDHYASPLPATLSTPDSIKALLHTWGYDPIRADDATAVGLTATDCSTEVAYSQYAEKKCNGTMSDNISVTDDTGTVHSLSSKITKTSP
jgi:hypothetical protein